MDGLQLLVDLHKGGYRQGPGSDRNTELAVDLAGIDRDAPLQVVDIGCGTGAATLVLARLLNAEVTAVDFLEDFLDVLESRADVAGVSDRITAICASMEAMPFESGQFDVIWSEGAIYNLGFERGASEWSRFLKPGGVLVASEITWTTDRRPVELQSHWDAAYPEIDTASSKLAVLQGACR